VYLAIDVKAVITAGMTVGVIGLVIGVLLGIAGLILRIKVDEKFLLIRSLLPGANCGGCGYSGCDSLAVALFEGKAEITACPMLGDGAHEELERILVVTTVKNVRKVAFIKCAGICGKVVKQYVYHGHIDCKKAAVVPGKGDKACGYGCVGYGTCVRTCQFGAIRIVSGCAVVDREKCTACGKCIAECPNKVIGLVPYKAEHLVECSSRANGRVTRSVCEAGCIGCRICVRQCEYDAIKVEDDLARIDYDKCTNCGKCAEKCPRKVIL